MWEGPRGVQRRVGGLNMDGANPSRIVDKMQSTVGGVKRKYLAIKDKTPSAKKDLAYCCMLLYSK